MFLNPVPFLEVSQPSFWSPSKVDREKPCLRPQFDWSVWIFKPILMGTKQPSRNVESSNQCEKLTHSVSFHPSWCHCWIDSERNDASFGVDRSFSCFMRVPFSISGFLIPGVLCFLTGRNNLLRNFFSTNPFKFPAQSVGGLGGSQSLYVCVWFSLVGLSLHFNHPKGVGLPVFFEPEKAPIIVGGNNKDNCYTSRAHTGWHGIIWQAFPASHWRYLSHFSCASLHQKWCPGSWYLFEIYVWPLAYFWVTSFWLGCPGNEVEQRYFAYIFPGYHSK